MKEKFLEILDENYFYFYELDQKSKNDILLKNNVEGWAKIFDQLVIVYDDSLIDHTFVTSLGTKLTLIREVGVFLKLIK